MLPKIASRWLQIWPKQPQKASGRLKEVPNMHHKGPTGAQRRLKRARTRINKPPRRAKMALEAFQIAQGASKTAQETPKTPPEVPREAKIIGTNV